MEIISNFTVPCAVLRPALTCRFGKVFIVELLNSPIWCFYLWRTSSVIKIFFRGSHLSFFSFPSPHFIFSPESQRTMISCDDGGDVCSNPTNKHKLAHRDRAITSFWSTGNLEESKQNSSLIFKTKPSRLQTRGTRSFVLFFWRTHRFCLRMEILIWNVNSYENKMWRPGAEAHCAFYDSIADCSTFFCVKSGSELI